MKIAKKTLSLLMIILMLISMIPANIFAGETTEEIPQDIYIQEGITPAEPLTAEDPSQESDTAHMPEEITDTPETPEKSADIIAAEAFISAVNAIGDVSLYDEKAIVDALRAYDSLSDLAKDMVREAKEKLDRAMSVLGYLKAEEEKRLERENRLIAVEEGLATVSSVTKEQGHTALENAISALEESYLLLSDEEKLMLDERLVLAQMPDYETSLFSAKALLTEWTREYDENIIFPIKEKLLSVENIMPEDGIEALESAINELTQMHSNLTYSQKLLLSESVGGYDSKLKDLSDKLEAWKNASDINTVISMLTEVSAIEKITPDNAELINDTKRALDIISDKSMIPAELIGSLDSAVVSLGQAISDKAAAQDVVSLIDNIGKVTLESEQAIVNAGAAYDLLTEEQRFYVSNIDTLTSAKAELSALKDAKIRADELIILIDSIGEVTSGSEEAVINARSIYDSLSDAGKAFVTNIDTLILAETSLNDIKTAGEVTDLINSIGEVNIDKLGTVEDIRDRYDSLTDTQKALVTNLDVLETAENVLKDHIAARKVIKLIDKLPEKATFTKDASIYSAKSAYDGLTEDQKELVENRDKINYLYRSLISMEEKLEEYLAEYGRDSLYIDDTTGYVTVSADIHDFLTDEDKDLIAAGKMVIYTVTVASEEFTYEDVNISLLPIEPEEVPFSPFYYIFISRAVASMSDGKVISEDSDVTSVHSIPGEMLIEITVTEDMIPEVSDITRLFTGLISPVGSVGEFSRIMDTDQNMNTITFSASNSVNIIPSFIDIINPMTGDNITIYIVFGAFIAVLIGILALRKKNSGK